VHAIPYGEQLSFLVISMTLSPFCCGLFHAAGKMKNYDGSPVKLIQIERSFSNPLGQKIEAIEGIVPVRRSLVGRCAAIGMTQQRIANRQSAPFPSYSQISPIRLGLASSKAWRDQAATPRGSLISNTA